MRKMIARSPTIESNKIADYTEIYSHKRIIESIIIFDRISDRIHLIINDSYFAGILLFVLTDVDFIFIIFFFFSFYSSSLHRVHEKLGRFATDHHTAYIQKLRI